MNYEKKYKEAIERAKGLIEGTREDKCDIMEEDIINIFPELKESEDAGIRGAIIDHLKDNNLTEWAAWLEKQGEQKRLGYPYVTGWRKNRPDNKPQIKHSVLMLTTHGVAEGEWLGDVWCQYRWSCKIKDEDVLYWLHLSDLESLEKEGNNNLISSEKIGKSIIRGIASSLTNYLDNNRYAGAMNMSNMECEDLEKSILDSNWEKVYHYMQKKLEKQGEQKSVEHFELKAGHWYFCHQAFCCRADDLTVKEGERFMCEEDGVVKGFVIKHPEKYFVEINAPESQDEKQNPADKAEPKFKIEKGQWYVCIQSFILDGNTVVAEGRTYKSQEDNAISGEDTRLFIDKLDGDASEYFRLWTIQDAKDGDVLYHKAKNGIEYIVMNKGLNEHNNIDSYFRYTSINGFGIDIPSVLSAKCDSITPATQKQRDLLFQKMKEAGYEWDAEKKELKKIEQKPVEQKPVEWNEEDVYMFNTILGHLNLKAELYKKDGNITEYDRWQGLYNWLKSLKSKYNQDCTRKEMIDKAKEFLYENFYEHPHHTGHICTDIDRLHDEDDAMDILADSLEKAMKA